MPLLDRFSTEQLPIIPYTQIQNVTADRILGRLTVSGSIQELTAAQVRTLINVSDGANAYTLPTATSTVLGGVELFSDTVQTVAANAVTTTASRTYGIQLNSSGQMVVNVPWIDTNTTYSAATSTTLGLVELFSDTVQTVAANAVTTTASRTYGIQVNSSGQMVVNIPWTDTVYTHPSYTARSIDTTGAQVIDVFTSDTSGSVTNITTRTMTLADLGYTGATNADNYSSWLLAASGTAGTATIGSGNTVTLSAGTGMTVTRATNTVTFATTITQYTDALARSAISLTTTGNSGAATYTSGTGVFNIPNYTLAGLGGFANPMTTLGDIIYGGASGAATRLAGNTTTTRQYLAQTGTGTVSAIPAWTTIAGSDVTGAALTSTNDTNVTVTLGGTPSTALLRAASLTLGWTGTLAVSRGGTGLSALGTANQLLRVNAGATALEYFTPSFLTSAITSLNGLTAATQTFANDTNVTITSATSTHTVGWSGQLSVARGGTGASTLTGVLIGNGTSAVTAVAGTASQLLRRNAAGNAYEFFTHNFETAFSKGDLVQGTAVTLSGTLTGRLVGTGNITVDHADTSTQASVSNADGTVLQSATLDTYGHTTALTSLNGDNRWARLIEVLNNSSTWSHVSLQNGIDFTGYTTGSSGYPSTLGFAVAFYASTSDSTSGFGRAFALNRAYNTEDYYIGSPNTSGVHNGWRLLYHSGNLSIGTLSGVPTSRTLTINGTAFDLSANRSWSVGTVTQVSGTGGYGGLTLSGTVNSSGNITLGGTPTGTWPISITGISAAVESGVITDLNAAWTLPGTSIPNRFYVYRYSNNATGSPENYDNANWLINIYSHPAGSTASYGHQLAAPDLEKIYFRRVIDGSFGPWRQLYHTGNLSNPVTGTGTSGQVAYFNSTSTVTSESSLVWDSTNDRLGIGTSAPGQRLHILGAGPIYSLVEANNASISAVITKNTVSQFAAGIYTATNAWSVVDITSGSLTRLMVHTNGNITVGTVTDSGYKLGVVGIGLFDDGLRTGAPAGSSAQTWKLGAANFTSSGTPTHQVIVEIAGTVYKLLAVV